MPPKLATEKQRRYLRDLGDPNWGDRTLTAEQASERISEYESDMYDQEFHIWGDPFDLWDD